MKIPLKDNDFSVNLICKDSLSQGDGRRTRQRTDWKKMHGRELQEHQKQNKLITDKTDEDKKQGARNMCDYMERKQNSSAQCVGDMAQCHANVLMYQQSQNWLEDGTADELGWTLLKERKEGMAAIAVKMKEFKPSKTFSQKHKTGTCCS